MDPVSPDDGNLRLHHQPPRFNLSNIPEDDTASSAAVAPVQNNRESDKNNGDSSGSGKGGGLDDKDDTEGARAKKQPGRPTGSKNKEKKFRIHVIEVADGHDIVDDISNFAQRLNRRLFILSGNGTVSNMTIRWPAMSSGALMTLHEGLFDIVSLSGSFLPPPAPPEASGLTICYRCSQGQLVGGSVAGLGRLVASGTVVIVAISFRDATYGMLSVPLEEEKTGGIPSQEDPKPSVHGGEHMPVQQPLQ